MNAPEDKQSQKADVETVLAEFDARKDDLSKLCWNTKSLVEGLLLDAKIQFQSIQGRIKARERLKTKYLDPQKDYKRLDDITDVVALRVITYYEDEVDQVAETIRREFEIDQKNSVDKRETEPDKFGYYALNLVCTYSKARTAISEYKKFAGVFFEIQITSILRHAWSEIEHPWYELKDAFPPDIKRRFARMAALLEIAESEFLSLKKLQSDHQRAVAVQVEAKVPDVEVDPVSLRSFTEHEPLVAAVDESLALVMGVGFSLDLPEGILERRSRAIRLIGITKLQDIRRGLEIYKAAIPEYVRRCRQEKLWPPRRSGALLYRSISVFHLATLLATLRSSDAIAEFYDALGIKATWDISKQVAIAEETVAALAPLHGGTSDVSATFPAGPFPFGMAFDGANLWVANNHGNSVTKFQARDGAQLGTYPVGQFPEGVAFDGANVWVTNFGGNTVTKLRASGGAALGTFAVGTGPEGLAFDGGNIWVANSGTNNVTKLNATNGAVLGAFAAGNQPRAVAFDGKNIWVTNRLSNNVTKLRASDGALLGTFPVGTFPLGICFDGAHIWVANANSNNVTKLRASDGAALGTFAVGNAPRAVVFDGNKVWIANTFDNTVSVLQAGNGAPLGTLPVGNAPQNLAFDGASVWVSNSGGNTISKL